MGFTMTARVTASPVSSYLTFSPLPSRKPRAWAVCFLWHCPWNHFRWALPSILLRGARTFLGAAETARDRLARSDSKGL